MSVEASIDLLLWLIAAVQGVLILGLCYEVSLLERAVNPTTQLAAARSSLDGKPAPAFSLPDLHSDRTLSLATFASRRGILLFLTSTCDTCIELAGALALLPPSTHPLIIVARGQEIEASIPRYLSCVADRKGALMDAYLVTKVPAAVLINEECNVARMVFPTSGSDVVDLLKLAIEKDAEMHVAVNVAASTATV